MNCARTQTCAVSQKKAKSKTKMNSSDALIKIIELRKKQIQELKDVTHPKGFWKNFNLLFTHKGFVQIKILNIQIKYAKMEIELLQKVSVEAKDK